MDLKALLNEKNRIIISIACLVVVTILVFLPSLSNGFTNWDDPLYVINNDLIKTPSLHNIKKILTSRFSGNYKPLVLLSFTLEYRFFKLNPLPYHATNLILHIFNALLVFWMICLLTRRVGVSFLTTLLFAVHPLRVESVAWISERKDVLYAFFFLLALISYAYYLRKQKTRYLVFCLAGYLLSLASKPSGIILPFLLLVFDYFEKRKFEKRVFVEKIPFLVLIIVILFVNMVLRLRHGNFILSRVAFPEGGIPMAGYRLIFYIEKIFAPLHLSCFYPQPGKSAFFLTSVFFLSALLVWALKSSKKFAFGGLFFLITILPALQIFTYTGPAFAADRYTYVPSIGIFYVLAEGFSRFYHSPVRHRIFLRVVLVFFLTVILAVLSFLTHQRTRVWKDSITLWSDVIKKYPRETQAYNNRGAAYIEWGALDKAVADFNKAMQIEPANALAYNNRGFVYFKRDDYKRAISDYNQAILLMPQEYMFYINRAAVYFKMNEQEKAREDMRKAAELKEE